MILSLEDHFIPSTCSIGTFLPRKCTRLIKLSCGFSRLWNLVSSSSGKTPRFKSPSLQSCCKAPIVLGRRDQSELHRDATEEPPNFKWRYVAPKLGPRAGVGVCFFAGKLFATGRKNDPTVDCLTLPSAAYGMDE